MINKIILHCLLLLSGIFTSYSQKLMFQNLGVKQGLPAMEVYNLFQDPQGYVWVFTEYGIVKHNGSKFIPVCQNLPLKESAVYAIAVSGSGETVIANSQARMYQIVNDKAILVKGLKKYTDEIGQMKLAIFNVYFDKQGKLYFTNFQKTYCIPKGQYQLQQTKEKMNRFVPASNIHPLIAVRKGDYPEGEMSLSILDRFGHLKQSLQRDSIYMSKTFGYELNGNNYLSIMQEIRLLRKNGSKKIYRFDKGIVNFKLSPNGHVWIAFSNGGLMELDEALNPLEHYLGNVTVSDILFDDQSGMWVSTIGEGVYYCRNTDNLSFQDDPELRGQISTLNVIGRKLFIGTASGKLFLKENQRLREIELKGNAASITDVIEFEGKFYIGTKGGIYILNQGFKLLEVLKINGYAFCKAKNGALMIVSGSTVYKFEKNAKSIELVKKNPWNRCIVERAKGEFFVILPDGIYRLKTTFSSPDYLRNLKGKNISTIKMDSSKNLWICTKGNGLYQLTPTNQLIPYTNLPSRIINDVSFLSGQTVLLSTNKGAFVKQLDQLPNQSSWKQLLDEEVLRMVPLGDEVLIGSSSGLSSVNIHKLFKPTNYKLYLSSVEIENKKIPLRMLQKLDYRQNDLYFNFDFLAYEEWSKKLNYDLQGSSALKGKVEGTQIHLQNLSPGNYTLLVYPEVNLAHKNKLVVVTSFYIEPAFWQTTFFLVSMIVLGLILTSFTSWLIMRNRRKKEMQRIHMERLLAEYRLTALKSQVNPHFMSNSLVAIQELIIRKETSAASQYLAKFSVLLRNLLNYSDQSVVSLYNELKMIDLYIDLEQLRFSNRFIFRKEIDEHVQLDQYFIPALITQPLIENAIWHGLLPLSGERSPVLTLTITLDETGLYISVKDNGVGRIPKEKKQLKSIAFKESKGTKLIEKRIENLNRLYVPNGGSITFNDLKDEKGDPAGLDVLIFFSLEMLNKLYHERNQERDY